MHAAAVSGDDRRTLRNHRNILWRSGPGSRLIAIATEFVTVLIFNAGLHARTGNKLIKVMPFAPISRSVPAVVINIIVVPTPIAIHPLTIFILVYHVVHLALTHAIHFPTFLGALFCPRVLGPRGLELWSIVEVLASVHSGYFGSDLSLTLAVPEAVSFDADPGLPAAAFAAFEHLRIGSSRAFSVEQMQQGERNYTATTGWWPYLVDSKFTSRFTG